MFIQGTQTRLRAVENIFNNPLLQDENFVKELKKVIKSLKYKTQKIFSTNR